MIVSEGNWQLRKSLKFLQRHPVGVAARLRHGYAVHPPKRSNT